MAKKNWLHAAGIVWPLLTDAARRGTPLKYADIAPKIGTVPINVRHALSPIQDYCRDKLPPLTSIVIGKGGKPGKGFNAWDIYDIKTAHSLVRDFPWDSVSNPYVGFGPADTIDILADRLVSNPGVGSEIYSKVKVRGVAQVIFRDALRKIYDNKCSMCGLSFPDALEAAHIISWQKADKTQRLDPRNGLLLCSVHHRLFDAGVITVSTSWKVYFRDQGTKRISYSSIDKSLTVDLHGKLIHLPGSKSLWPSPPLLAAHHAEKRWGNLS